MTDCEQVEHSFDWFDDLLSWSSCEHSRVTGLACEMWKQDPDSYQDWSQL